jgi:hypothetical protein
MSLTELMNGVNGINLANLFNLSSVEMGLILLGSTLSLFLLNILIFSISILARRNRKKHPLLDSNQLKTLMEEAESVCHAFSKNLEEKREIAKRLLEQLERKIQGLDCLLHELGENGNGSDRPFREKEDFRQIFEMAEAGCDITEIARKLSLSRGEVQFVLGLRKYDP